MKYYRIKSTEKGAKPPRWYRLLVPSGITFSQLYVLLAYVHGELYGLSSWYYFETKDCSLTIEEFTDNGPRFPGILNDIYDAKGTYIDTVFHEGLKISQYTGTDFDLSIAVENEAEEIPGLAAPKIIKASKAVILEEGPTFENETLPEQLFGIKIITGNRYESAEKLVSQIGRETLMYTSRDPVTPVTSIVKGSRTKGIESLSRALDLLKDDKELKVLIDQMEADKAEGRASDPIFLAKVNNRMLDRFGMTFTEYTFMAAMKGLDPELSETYTPDEKPDRPAVTTEQFINSYTKEDLLIIADDYDLILPAKKTKKNLANAVLKQLFTAESIRTRLMQLKDGEMELFRLTAESEYGRFPETDEEELQAENLIDDLLVVPLRENRLFVTDLLRNVYEESDKAALELERQKTVWMYKCLNIAALFYGVMGWDVLGQLYARGFKGISHDELIRVYRRTPWLYNDFEERGDKLILEAYIPDDYYKYLEEKIQQDKPFYIPSRREIEEFYDKGCLLSSSSHQAMLRFLINKLGYERDRAETMIAEMYMRINNNDRMQTIVDRLMEDLGEDAAFSSNEDVTEFAQLYMNMQNYSHLIVNRGYTPNDLHHVMGVPKGFPKGIAITPRSPEAAKMLDEAREELAKQGVVIDEKRVGEMLEGEKRKKIGRNEPCPCGSGKKYKNCCGK